MVDGRTRTGKVVNRLKMPLAPKAPVQTSGEVREPIGDGMYLPNLSGDHSAGRVLRTPENDTDIANKKYVDDNAGGDVKANIRNTSGSTMTKGQTVFVNGYNAGQDLPTVDLADASSSSTMPALGLVTADIANNENGECTVMGKISSIDTSTFSDGDSVFVSTTAGGISAEPSGTDLVQRVGTVLRSHATLGVLGVNVQSDPDDDTINTVTAPITLTGVDLGLDLTTTYDWSGVHEFQTNVKLQFRDTGIFIHSNSDGELTVEADTKLILGKEGDIVLGGSNEFTMRPQTDVKMNLGDSTHTFAKIFTTLPTSDPSVTGQLWNNSGVVNVSA